MSDIFVGGAVDSGLEGERDNNESKGGGRQHYSLAVLRRENKSNLIDW